MSGRSPETHAVLSGSTSLTLISQLPPILFTPTFLGQALGTIATTRARGGDEIAAELFQTLKDAAVSAALHMPANLENSAVATGLEKVGFHSNPKERQCQRMLKPPHNCTHLTR